MAKQGSVKKLKENLESMLSNASEITALAEEMGEWRDNLEEKFSSTDKYSRVSDAADALEGSDLESLCDGLITAIGESEGAYPEAEILAQEIEHEIVVPYKGKSLSRATRAAEACSTIRMAVEAITDKLDELESALDTEEERENEGADKRAKGESALDTEEEREKMEAEREKKRDAIDGVREHASEVTDAIDEIEGVEFPGMYG